MSGGVPLVVSLNSLLYTDRHSGIQKAAPLVSAETQFESWWEPGVS